MKIILLGGQNISNKEWIESIQKRFKEKFTNTQVLYYKHWDNQEKETDVEFETHKFLELVNNLKEDYYVFAKSIGSVILFNSLSKLENKPKGVMLCGVPLHLAKESGYDFLKLRELVTFPVNIYQKLQDPFCSYEDLKVLENENIKVEQYVCTNEPEDNHHYENLEYIYKIFDQIVG